VLIVFEVTPNFRRARETGGRVAELRVSSPQDARLFQAGRTRNDKRKAA
jgi:hypothetical protein